MKLRMLLLKPGYTATCGCTDLETIKELVIAPGGNDLDFRIDGVESQLEPHLIIALTGAAMGNVLTVSGKGSSHLATSNDGTGQTSAKKVLILVDGVALNGFPAELLDELALQIINDHLFGADLKGLLLDGSPVLLLSDIGKVADDRVTFLQEIVQDCRGIKAAGVGQADFAFAACQGCVCV